MGGKRPGGNCPRGQKTGGGKVGGKRPRGAKGRGGGGRPGGKRLGGKRPGGKRPGGKSPVTSDSDAVIDWTYENNDQLNSSKTAAMIFGTRLRISNLRDPDPFIMRGSRIKFVKSHVYLGVTLDQIMSLGPLRKNIKKYISNKIFKLRKTRKYLNFDASVAVYKQTILFMLEYAGFL